ncbi:helicase-related protein [Euhalothece natronophila]|uniref:helicase-related protein n=1 Tax=Euhalothece natronophila TaxID=577489 RepID=UPI0028F40790|nr:helicase-related protein [Euhalothece natronophila]
MGLIKPEFEDFDLENLTESQRAHLAQHLIQRRRADVQDWITTTSFPERESLEKPYRLSPEYRKLFSTVYDFARGLVKTDSSQLSQAQQRGRYWSALAIIRCVMSSPAAAIATLKRQASKDLAVGNTSDVLDEQVAASYTYDPTDQEQAVDAPPTIVVEQGKQSYQEKDRRQLREFVRQAEQLQGKGDLKLERLYEIIEDLLPQGYQPIIWCRYISTANYLTEQLRQQFSKKKKKDSDLRIIGITGELSEDEREIRLDELITYPKRVLVATDCLSEGVNLQLYFNAVIHYDLPWNPNRLEQREGRIDRYGQTAQKVKCFLLYGQDNPVDGAVLDVLIRKAVNIHKTLGITVPVPLDSNDVSEAVFESLFEHAEQAQQLSLLELLDDQDTALLEVQKSWDRAVERERKNRSRFAQRSIKPEQVQAELEDSDRALGSNAQVENFVNTALERLNASLIKKRDSWRLPNIPACLVPVLGDRPRDITFTSPAPEGIEVIGRNHPLVETLAKTLLEEALESPENSVAARCGFTVTDLVNNPVFVLLLRGRYLIKQRRTSPLLAEECWLQGFTGVPSQAQWLTPEETETLFNQAKPVADYPRARKQQTLHRIIDRLEELTPSLEQFAHERAESISQSHQRVRSITKEGKVNVEPQLPLDILGVYILQPK